MGTASTTRRCAGCGRVKRLQGQGLPLARIRARLGASGGEASVLSRVEHLRAELQRLDAEVAAAAPEDEHARATLRAAVAGAASDAATLAQALMRLLTAGMVGLL